MLSRPQCKGCGERIGWFECGYSIRGLVSWIDGEWHCRCWESWLNGYEAGLEFADMQYEDAGYPGVMDVFAGYDDRRKRFMN